MLGAVLRLNGHDVRLASEAEAGIEIARRFQPHVILCDLGLPKKDGYEVARRVKGEPDLRGARLIAVSGYGQDDDRRRSREAGFDRHLVKPVEPDTLSALLQSMR